MGILVSPDKTAVTPKNPPHTGINWRLLIKILAALAVFTLALVIRLEAADYLPADYDEDDYLRAGQFYAQHLAAGDLGAIASERINYEHPPMTKLVYGLLLVIKGPESYQTPVEAGIYDKEPDVLIAEKVMPFRIFGAITGSLTAGAVALVNPLAGLLVAVNSWHVKYTSQAMLEALPCLFAALMLLSLYRSRRNGDAFFWASAVFLGLTASGKYLYAVAGIAGLIWILWRDKKSWRIALLWGAISLLVFYLTNPAIWTNPFANLYNSLTFSIDFSNSAHVKDSGFGWAQPITWLFTAVPWLPRQHPEVFPVLLDGLFSLFGLLAIARMWRSGMRERLVVLFFAVYMLFLFFWPTKWPQYILTVTIPISILAARWLEGVGRRTFSGWREWRHGSTLASRSWRGALLWLFPAILLLSLIVVYPLVLQAALAGTTFQTLNLRDGAGALLLGTGRGFIGMPPDYLLTRPIIYTGTGSFFGIFMWEEFSQVLRFNILWTAVTMALATSLGIWLALLLQRKGVLGRQFWRTLFILPWALPEFVGALIWNTLFDDLSGGVNNIMNIPLDARSSYRWLSDGQPLVDFVAFLDPAIDALNSWKLDPIAGILEFTAYGLSISKPFVVMVVVGVWVAFPFMMLIATVALRSISIEVLEAARVDGAIRWSMWWHITWPLIRPVIWSGVLLRGVLLFNAFHLPLMLFNDTRGTGTTTISLASYYSVRYDFGFNSSAMLNIVAMALAIGLIWLFNRRTHVVEGVQYA